MQKVQKPPKRAGRTAKIRKVMRSGADLVVCPNELCYRRTLR
jgi:hypothetical protein